MKKRKTKGGGSEEAALERIKLKLVFISEEKKRRRFKVGGVQEGAYN